jgi:uncharacterized protein
LEKEPGNTTAEESEQSKQESRHPKKGWLRKHFIDPLVGSANPPWFDARGIALGLFIGAGFPLGTHTISLGLLRLLFRYNVVVAFAFTFVNNPVTILPMYYGFYWLGCVILGDPALMSMEDFHKLIHPMISAGHFWEAVKEFLALGADLLLKWTIGAAIASGVIAAIGYAVGYWLLRKRCLNKARKLGTTYEKLVKELESSVKA